MKKYIFPILICALTVLFVGVSLFESVPEAQAASSSELLEQLNGLEAEKEQLEAELKELEEKLSDNLDEMEKIIAQKDIIDQEVFNLRKKMENINAQITVYNTLIADKQEELDEAETRLKDMNEKNKLRIRAMEENGVISYWSVLFEANSFTDFLDRLNMMEEIAASDQQRLKEMRDVATQIAEAKQELVKGQEALLLSKEELKQTQTTMETKREEAEALLAQLIATGEEYEKYIAEKEAEENELIIQIGDTENLYEDAKYQEWLATSVPATTKPPATSPSGGNTGEGTTTGGVTWLKPTSYTRVSSPFGWRIHPVYGDWRFHNGVDLSAGFDTPIVASRSGKVVIAQWSDSAGYYVTIDHGDGFQSKYLHMTHYIVGVGDYVTAGQVIGYVGDTGVSKGAHLHFTITYNGEYVNPADYIDF